MNIPTARSYLRDALLRVRRVRDQTEVIDDEDPGSFEHELEEIEFDLNTALTLLAPTDQEVEA